VLGDRRKWVRRWNVYYMRSGVVCDATEAKEQAVIYNSHNENQSQ
jgi:hypothetical protein